MTGYVVWLRHTIDDLPIRLFADKDDAVAYAKKRRWHLTARESGVFGVDCSTPCCVHVVEYKRGVPKSIKFVRAYD